MNFGLIKKLLFLSTFIGALFLHSPVKAQQAVGLHLSLGKPFTLAALKAAANNPYMAVAPGFGYQYTFSEKIAVWGSLGVLSTGYYNEFEGLKWGSEHDGMGNWVPDPNLPHQGEMRTFLVFSALQAGTKIFFSQNRLRTFLQPYLEADVYLSSRNTTLLYLDNGDLDSKTSSSEPINPQHRFVFSTGIGFGWEMDLGDYFTVYLIPEVKWMTSNLASTIKTATVLIPALKMGVWYKI